MKRPVTPSPGISGIAISHELVVEPGKLGRITTSQIVWMWLIGFMPPSFHVVKLRARRVWVMTS